MRKRLLIYCRECNKVYDKQVSTYYTYSYMSFTTIHKLLAQYDIAPYIAQVFIKDGCNKYNMCYEYMDIILKCPRKDRATLEQAIRKLTIDYSDYILVVYK